MRYLPEVIFVLAVMGLAQLIWMVGVAIHHIWREYRRKKFRRTFWDRRDQ